MPPAFVTRFAPSPNGYLHLGHAFSALTAYNAAQAHGGKMLLRVDDIDTSRAREEYILAIYEDLAWLGLSWPQPVRLQSAHFKDYQAAAARLRSMGVTYPCFCTRSTLRLDAAQQYAGTCKGLTQADIAARIKGGDQAAIRLDVAASAAALKGVALRYEDTGKACQVDSSTLEDAVIIRKDIGTSYLLSCVVDDAAQHITHVVRGHDIQPLTGLQVLLQRLLGLPTPIYRHHSLISDAAQQKLSKSKSAPSLRDARAAGLEARDIRRQLGFDTPEITGTNP